MDQVKRFEDFLRIRNRAPDTIKRYMSTAREFLQVVGEKDSYGPGDVEAFLIHVRGRAKSRGFKDEPEVLGSYLRYCYYCLKTFYRSLGIPWGFEKEAVPKLNDPHQLFYKYEDIVKILDAARKVRRRDWVALRVLSLAYSRRKSLAELRTSDYDPDQATVRMPSIKGGRRKIIQLDQETKRELDAYLAGREDSYPALFVSEKPTNPDGAIGLPMFNYLLSKYAKLAGCENKGLHAFRRGMITYLWEQGMKEIELAEGGDWKNREAGLKMVAKYVQLSPKYAQERIQETHPFYKTKGRK